MTTSTLANRVNADNFTHNDGGCTYTDENGNEYTAADIDAVIELIAKAETECELQCQALAIHLGCLATEISERHDVYEAISEQGEYLVLTDCEADAACDEALESYIDDCILPECPAAIAPYFDRDAWKRDALLSDGRGHTLASYDGDEAEVQLDGEWFYIYRVN